MTALAIALALALAGLGAVAWSLWRRLQRAEARRQREMAEERSRHETALRTETARVAAIFDRMLDGLVIVGVDGRIVFANRAAGEFFATTKSMVGRTVLEATRRHEVAAMLQDAERHSQALGHELRLDHGGKTRILQVHALALGPAEGIGGGTLLIFNDITRLRQLESVRQDFVANVSHELRTPLSLIKGAAETLLDGAKSDPVARDRFLDIIDKNAGRLTLLIDDLLLLARLDSDRLELRLQPVGLQRAAQEALDDAALLARSRGVSLRNEIPADLTASADPERLRQVLANLIDNAIKYGRANGVVVLSGSVCSASEVEVVVRDDGPGIPPEARARVFERFYRVDKARDREQGGTGLGLAIVRNVVEAHGGAIHVESDATGTRFSFTLPNAAAQPSGREGAR